MLSVVICTRNPRPCLGRVLEALRAQTLPLDQWELLVVDNASAIPVENRFDISWHPNAKHVYEPEQGTSLARKRGIKETSSPLIVFVDDDNVLQRNYLETELKIDKQWPFLGTWGCGCIKAEFEVPPAKQLAPYLEFLALRNYNQPYLSSDPILSKATPVGAGLCVRREVALAYLEFYEKTKLKLNDRADHSLTGGGDYELSYVGCKIGKGMGVFPELKMIHVISRERVTEEYFLRLLVGAKITTTILEYKWQNILPRTWGFFSLIKSLILRRGFDRRLYFEKRKALKSAKFLISQQK